jgi:parallel beta-helix repeat protein
VLVAVLAVVFARADAPAPSSESAQGPTSAGAAGAGQQGGTCDKTLTVREATRLARRRSTRGGRAVERFVNSLRPGQTGCLRRGTYLGDVAIWRSGVTLRSRPGEAARVVGRVWIKRRTRGVELRNLALDGRNSARLPSPTVNGVDARFVDLDVTNGHSGICFILGSVQYGRAEGTLIEGNRIHDCGRLPARNKEHGIYVSAADDTRIVGNEIYGNADRGIQLYPDAQRTTIERNVIDGNGQGIIFSGADGVASDDNLVRNNVISNAKIRADVESWYPPGNPLGTGNVVQDNCVFGGRTGTIDTGGGGFAESGNITADPGFANPAGGDFRVASPNPCTAVLAGG